jgi:hypothetical protein
VLLVFILGFAGVIYSNYQKNMTAYAAATAKVEASQTAKAEKKKEESELEKYGWKTITVDPPIYGEAPDIPDVPPLVLDPWGQPDLSMVLKYLLLNHPEREIREDMFRLIESDELPINFQVQEGNVAAFSYRSRSEVVAEDSYDPREFFPMFSFDPAYLRDMRTKEQALYAMLVVGHEYGHYLQWETEDEEGKRSFMPKKDMNMQEEDCALFWRTELEVYRPECRLSNSWGGVTDLRSQCDRVESEEGFNQIMFAYFIKSTFGKGIPQCHEVWARIGGAPHPEYYRLR